MRMDVQDNPDIEFPVVIVSHQPAGRRADRDRDPDHPAGRSGGPHAPRRRRASARPPTRASADTVVEFEIGTDVDQAVNEVKNAIDQIRGDLPDGILEPSGAARKRPRATRSPISRSAPTDMTLEQLSWFVDDTVAKRLLADRRAWRRSSATAASTARSASILDPARMQSLGRHRQPGQPRRCARSTSTPPAAAPRSPGRASRCACSATPSTPIELSQTQIAARRRADGPARRHRQRHATAIGEQTAHRQDPRHAGRHLLASRAPRARRTSPSTTRRWRNSTKLEKDNPGRPVHAAVHQRRLYQGAIFDSSMLAMVEGAVLAVLVVFLFLRDWRATLISALAIPLSAIPTFWFMDLLGFTLNTLSLLALSLVAGVLVDDAIVEIENIVRHMRMGKSAYQASIDAADEIGLAVVATTLSIVAVFLPVGLMPGISGQFFKNFGLPSSSSVLMSLARRAHDHADDRGLFPQGPGPRAPWRRLADGPLHGHPPLVARHRQGQGDAGPGSSACRRSAVLPGSSNSCFVLLVLAGIRRRSRRAQAGGAARAAGDRTANAWRASLLALVAGYPRRQAARLIAVACRPIGGCDVRSLSLVTFAGALGARASAITACGSSASASRRFVATIGMFMVASEPVLPDDQLGLQPGQHRDGAGHDARADRGRRRPGRGDHQRGARDGDMRSSASARAMRNIFITLKKDRERTSIEFERGHAPQLAADRRRARQLPVAERRRRHRPRHLDHAVGLRSGAAQRTASKLVDADERR